MSSNATVWLNFALQQIAAESYLQGIDLQDVPAVKSRLLLGNNNILGISPTEADLTGKTRFTSALADQFLARYQIVDHHASDATGFSATLLFDRETQQYTLSIRSTEYRDEAQGGDWQRDGLPGADGEIKDYGFALAQLVSLERYWRELTAAGGKVAPDAKINVTGYSLSGHLATVFTEMHSDRILQTYTFNGAGRGFVSELGQDGQPVEQTLRRMVLDLEGRLLAFDSDGTLFRSGAAGNIYGDAGYDAARQATLTRFPTIGTGNIEFFTVPAGVVGGIPTQSEALGKVVQLIGNAETGSDVQFVANSGIHAPSKNIFIEGQPLLEGFNQQREFQYGNTHSLTLLVDSLALQELFLKVDPNLEQSKIEDIFNAVSAQRADVTVLPGVIPQVEGDTLEKSLDALRKVFLGNVSSTPFGRQPGDFGNFTNRNAFYQNIQQVTAVLTGALYRIDSLVGESASNMATIALQDGPDDALGVAYRYALKELNPFVLRGADRDTTQALYSRHNEMGELSLLQPDTGVGDLTSQYLEDRAAFLVKKIEVDSHSISLPSPIHFNDLELAYELGSDALPLPQVLFGGQEGDFLTGSLLWGDHLYGGQGKDQLYGQGGKDYLEGNQDDDLLDGGSGADTMLGGPGDDVYIVDNIGDVVREYANGGRDEVKSSVTFTLDSQVENLTIIGTSVRNGMGNELANTIVGNSARNVLSGLGGEDHLVGNGGNDSLLGGAGDFDLLEGGIGFDTYIYNVGDGMDRIEDSDARGQIVFDSRVLQGGIRRTGDAGNTYTSLDGRTNYVMSGTDLIVNGVLIVNENFQSGQMGIQLRDMSGMPRDIGVPTGPFVDTYLGGGESEAFSPGLGPTEIHANGGNDILSGDNWAVVGAFNDLLDGGSGDDVFIGGFGDDYLIGGSGNDYAMMTEGDMFLGGAGDDYAVGVADFWDSSGLRVDGGAYYADGGMGNDTFLGEMGADVLLGGDGNDILRGENRPAGWMSLFDENFMWNPSPQPAVTSLSGGDDYLDGGAGNDLLVGDGGNDILLGGAGDDRLYGESDFTQTIAGEDWLDGGEGNDSLFGGAGADMLSGGDGDDLLVGDFSGDPGAADILDGGAGADELQGGGGDDILYGGSGMDRLAGFAGNDFLDGGADADELQGGLGDDELWGGAGNDRMIGQEGNDTLFGDEGDDELQGDAGSDTLFGGEGHDALFGQDGDDVLSGEAGDDVLNGGLGNDQLDGGDGIDDVQGREGDDFLVGGAGNDFLYGDGNNPTVLSLAGGNDTLDGEEGDDQLWAGAGQDQLFGGEGSDQLVGDAGDDLLYGEAGNDLLFGDSPFFSSQAGSDVLDGGEGDDTLQGGGGEDDLQGGRGNDLLIGGSGLDTYRFNLGDGTDTIQDDAVQRNRLIFGAGITAESLSLDVAPSDSLVLRVGNGEDSIQITGFGLDAPAEFHTIRQFEFADGTVLTDAELLARGFQLSSPESGGTLQGTSFADRMQGSQVGDWLKGRGGNDVLLGGLGDDVLQGEAGDDELDGGAGNDRLYGNDGSNVLRGGEGNDILESAGLGDQLFGGAGDDAYHLRSLGQVITEEINAGTDTIYLSPTESLTFQTPNNVENVRIEDDLFLSPTTQVNLVGNALDNELSGSHRLDGQAGNDTLIGTGDNTFVFGRGYGQDTVETGSQWYAHTGLDRVEVLSNIASADLIVENHGHDLVLRVSGTNDQLTVRSYFSLPGQTVDEFVFADGTVWGLANIESRMIFVGSEADDWFDGTVRDDVMQGLGGNDQLRASSGNDTLDGGVGNDFLEGYSGNDTYVFGRGYGQDAIDEQGVSGEIDTLKLIDGIAPSEITLRATPDFGTDAVLSINGTEDQVNLGGFFTSDGMRVDRIQFSDGTVWDYNAMLAHTEGVNLVGTEDTDYFYGNVTNDTLFGMGGDDTLSGGAGNDTLDGGTGADRMTGGSGNDLFVVDNINDIVIESAGQGTDTVSSSLTYALGSNLENLTLTGTAAINGTGNSLNNTLTGNSAVNVLTGGAGNDTYVVGLGDTVIEAASAGTDTVKSDISWTLGTNLENLILTGVAAVNGTGNSLANTLTGNSAANILSGEAGADTLIGAQGDDLYLVDNVGDKVTELAGEGLDTIQSSVTYTLSANVENLTLSGTSAINGTGNGLDNVMTGNSAANQLTGGAGNDTYVVGAGDTVVEGVNAGIDTVQSSVTHTLAANVENLTLTGTAAINGTGNALNNILVGNTAVNTLTGGAGDDTYVVGTGDTVVEAVSGGIDTVQSSVTWTLGANVENLTLTGTAAINGTGNTLANSLIGNAGNNVLMGGDGNDTLSGGKGNDVLNGGTGNDVFQLARGDGQDTITDASGTGDRLNFASGINPLDLMLSQSANDLRIAVYGSTDQVTIANWYGGAANQIETVQAGNGQQLMSTQVNQLIQAMAGFTQQTGLSWDQAIAQRPQDVQQILAANWH
ncbi:MAG: hypothetical protein JSR62_03555 [Nitrospira sp.]|nr:hypothetical protein [Nitrospira sp.]